MNRFTYIYILQSETDPKRYHHRFRRRSAVALERYLKSASGQAFTKKRLLVVSALQSRA